VRNGLDSEVQVLLNGDNANTAATVMGYATATVRGASADLSPPRRAPPAGPLVVLEPRVWFNPQLESTLFLVPGLIAYIAMITAVVSTALSIVREKERGTMEQIRMSPVGMLSFVVGKSVPYLLLSFVSSMGILLAGMALFDVPMRGEWWLLVLSTTLFLMAALGMGLLVSTVAESQQMAFQIALLASFLPTFVLSGFIFPIASMPWVVQWFTYTVPARYYLVALRGVVLKGVGLPVVADQLAALAVFTVAVVGLAALRLAREQRA
jgi:ABC-2 type transport system permease protein